MAFPVLIYNFLMSDISVCQSVDLFNFSMNLPIQQSINPFVSTSTLLMSGNLCLSVLPQYIHLFIHQYVTMSHTAYMRKDPNVCKSVLMMN